VSGSPAEVQEEVRDSILRGQTKMKTQYDRKHFDGNRYEVSKVVVMLKQPLVGQLSKLQVKYREKSL